MIRNWPESLKETKDMRERVKILWEMSFPISNFPFFLPYSLFSIVPQFAPTRSQQVRGLCADQCRVSCLTNRRGMVEGHARMIPSLSAVFHRPFSSFSGTVAHLMLDLFTLLPSIRIFYFVQRHPREAGKWLGYVEGRPFNRTIQERNYFDGVKLCQPHFCANCRMELVWLGSWHQLDPLPS